MHGHAGTLHGREWALNPDAVDDVARTLARVEGVFGSGVDLGALEARAAERRREAESGAPAGIALIPVSGVLLPKAAPWMAEYGIGSTTAIARMVQAARSDAGVRGAIVALDSPGGDVRGIEEAADLLAALSSEKPTVGVVEHMAASAAYWIGAQASELISAPSGISGSIGVITSRVDATAMLARDGIRWHVMTAGPHKAEGHPATELSDAERDAIQERLGGLYAAFLGGVSRGRRVPAARVEAEFGGGRAFYGRDAVARGMVDRLGGMGDALAALDVRLSSGSGHRAQGNADPLIERVALTAEILRLRGGHV